MDPEVDGGRSPAAEDGASGWDAYAPFYDWENAQTIGRRDVAFWKHRAVAARGRVLELGCGTGRLLMPLSRAGAGVTGVDLSAPMLARAHARARRLPVARRPRLVRSDIRALPFRDRAFSLAIAPYGMLQSLTTDAHLDAALAEAARVLAPGGLFGVDLVPDLPNWDTYQRQVRLRGKMGRAAVTLTESVRQDRRRGVTIFDEEFSARERGRTRRHRFSLTFRTLAMETMLARIARAGFTIADVCGDYRGGAWRFDADVWLVMARRTRSANSSGGTGLPNR